MSNAFTSRRCVYAARLIRAVALGTTGGARITSVWLGVDTLAPACPPETGIRPLRSLEAPPGCLNRAESALGGRGGWSPAFRHRSLSHAATQEAAESRVSHPPARRSREASPLWWTPELQASPPPFLHPFTLFSP